jgi:hypothetical protein
MWDRAGNRKLDLSKAAQGGREKEPDMTQLNGNHGIDTETTHGAHYEALAFAPGSAFAWTLRSAEIARRAQQRPRSLQTDRKTFDDNRPDTAQINGSDTNMQHVARYETPAFDPGSAFAWTLRSAEIARRGRRQQRTRQPLLAAA